MDRGRKKSFDEAIDSAEYGKCVEISTQSAIKKWLLPEWSYLNSVAVGFGGGAICLEEFLQALPSGVLLALFNPTEEK